VEQLQQNIAVYQLFQNAGWTIYFEILQGFDVETTLEFTQNLIGEKSMVRGIEVFVTEEIIARVMGLPQEGE
jgi:hypothetical protein